MPLIPSHHEYTKEMREKKTRKINNEREKWKLSFGVKANCNNKNQTKESNMRAMFVCVRVWVWDANASRQSMKPEFSVCCLFGACVSAVGTGRNKFLSVNFFIWFCHPYAVRRRTTNKNISTNTKHLIETYNLCQQAGFGRRDVVCNWSNVSKWIGLYLHSVCSLYHFDNIDAGMQDACSKWVLWAYCVDERTLTRMPKTGKMLNK